MASMLYSTSCAPQATIMQTQYPTLLPSPTPAVRTFAGNLQNPVYNLEQHMPLAKSDAYIVPDEKEQKAFTELVSRIEAGDFLHASELAKEYDYSLTRFLDHGNEKASSHLLQETRPRPKGWGMYVLREEKTNNIIVEAPHPLADKRSDLVALDIYRALNARALLIAGAHRDANYDGSADVSHTSESIFQSVHETLLQDTSTVSGVPVVLQIHGFATNKHPDYPRVVLGFGQTISQAEISLANELVDVLLARDVTADICDGDSWQDLCGTKNVQGSHSEGVIFLHIELEEAMRSDDSLLIASLSLVFTK